MSKSCEATGNVAHQRAIHPNLREQQVFDATQGIPAPTPPHAKPEIQWTHHTPRRSKERHNTLQHSTPQHSAFVYPADIP